MFGESDTGESPRVGSPWDALISTPSPPSPKYVPKLVPEAEEGNVEYKLQLLSPSPARFARLVTQLKWRLLEGGGQAYYELGVADSGALIGLPRADLERTLETLECMAGEIGASVIIVKEVEVPKGMHMRGGDRAGLFAGMKGKERLENGKGNRWEAVSTSESETPSTDDDAIFSMDELSLDGSQLSVDLEISTVYKPRPVRASQSMHHSAPRVHVTKHKKSWPAHSPSTISATQTNSDSDGKSNHTKSSRNRRAARDLRREEKRQLLLENAEQEQGLRQHNGAIDEQERKLVEGLENLQVAVTPTSPLPEVIKLPISTASESLNGDEGDPTETIKSPHIVVSTESPLLAPTILPVARSISRYDDDKDNQEPRLIVEALVVRKLSLEEAFLDFGGFQLI
ncbi:hypothetical protein HWV62_16752 [Athelia sp. TMB]|nr:hypothetical protein HWV62_16752 [Athelia sp. TMB]